MVSVCGVWFEGVQSSNRATGGAGVATYQGTMIDLPVLRRAARLLAAEPITAEGAGDQ